MPPVAATTIFCATAYLLGGVPFGLVLGLCHGVDIRSSGSGNVGATNLSRALGRRWGIAAFVLDFAKGLLPVWLVWIVVERNPERFSLSTDGWLAAGVGLCAIGGHVFSPYLRFRGGKGVATTFGVMAALSWISTAVAAGVWLVVYRWTRTVSVASMAAALTLPLAVLVVESSRGAETFTAVESFAVFVMLLIGIRHRANLRRLLHGEELTFRRPERDSTAEGQSDDAARAP